MLQTVVPVQKRFRVCRDLGFILKGGSYGGLCILIYKKYTYDIYIYIYINGDIDIVRGLM